MRSLLIILFIISASSIVGAQTKFGYVDTDYVLSQMPEYQEAEAELEKISAEWEKEIREMAREIDGMYASLKAEEVLLTPEMKQERMEEIKEKEQELKEYQKKVFGFEGLYFLKQQELVKPIQDLVFEAVEKVARENRLMIMFDKAADLVMIYTDPRYDYTDFVLIELGLGNTNDVLK